MPIMLAIFESDWGCVQAQLNTGNGPNVGIIHASRVSGVQPLSPPIPHFSGFVWITWNATPFKWNPTLLAYVTPDWLTRLYFDNPDPMNKNAPTTWRLRQLDGGSEVTLRSGTCDVTFLSADDV